MPTQNRCPECGRDLSQDSLDGLCPTCVGRGAFGPAPDDSQSRVGLPDLALPRKVEDLIAQLKPEDIGDEIGPYKLLQMIGEGGFGTVWMAEQERPVRRRVALKIIKLGMDTKEVIARFEQERQALAV